MKERTKSRSSEVEPDPMAPVRDLGGQRSRLDVVIYPVGFVWLLTPNKGQGRRAGIGRRACFNLSVWNLTYAATWKRRGWKKATETLKQLHHYLSKSYFIVFSGYLFNTRVWLLSQNVIPDSQILFLFSLYLSRTVAWWSDQISPAVWSPFQGRDLQKRPRPHLGLVSQEMNLVGLFQVMIMGL